MHLGRIADRLRRFLIDGVLGVHDTPHRIALGFAIGMFVTFTPTIGFQMGLIVAACALLRANKVVGVPLAWITNPATLWLFVPGYLLGCFVLGEPPEIDALVEALERVFAISGSLSDRLVGLRDILWEFFAPLWAGSLIVATVLGAISYVVIYRAVVAYRRRRAAAQTPVAVQVEATRERV